jgi:ABC-type multidrug transport system fused ATPase/permease subunit
LLRDLSLDLAVGTILGISGRSGAGKSTVAKIAAGLIMPWKGDAFLRGESIFQKDPCSAGIAYVAQGATLLGDTVADHVRMGRNELGDEDIEKAIVAAKADFVFERDKGLAAPIERNGSNFSGGERERIELARALAGNPKLLILDEATQSMDSHVEKEIVDYLRLRGMTVMIIAQRLDTLLACDQIVMIETGNASRPMTPDEFGNVVARSVCEEAS